LDFVTLLSSFPPFSSALVEGAFRDYQLMIVGTECGCCVDFGVVAESEGVEENSADRIGVDVI
jgi:hypothetical protein